MRTRILIAALAPVSAAALTTARAASDWTTDQQEVIAAMDRLAAATATDGAGAEA